MLGEVGQHDLIDCGASCISRRYVSLFVSADMFPPWRLYATRHVSDFAVEREVGSKVLELLHRRPRPGTTFGLFHEVADRIIDLAIGRLNRLLQAPDPS